MTEPTRVFVTQLMLTDFRNHPHLTVAADRRIVVLAGENGAGKTNVLEAVSMMSPGRGLRRAAHRELSRIGGGGGWAVSGVVEGPWGCVRIGTGLQPGDAARNVRIDGEPQKSADVLTEHLRVMWLTPAMDGLFTGPASDRRRFLDRMVLSLDPVHGRRVASFEQALTQRNRILEEIRPDPGWLDAVEAQIAELGVAVAAARREAVACLTRLIGDAHDPEAAFPDARIALSGELEDALAGASAAELEDWYRTDLAAGRSRDRAAGRTLAGPHRSDLVVHHGPKDMPAALSSTGEQKALLVGLVLAQARLVTELARQTPVLLLDEVAAHLDARRRAALFDILQNMGVQAYMTGTDRAAFAALEDRAFFLDFTPADTGGG
ncbi:DNA replication/repair protein RecF [Chthonobacter albigriseus]|uniref:DNA replication/repair protein RecF n=1 Tax=Chthonobacter albigriseus TaxID=1683161 RepID=UPI0015EF2478|nr:DNA replication/repair protein RecF [Chthonobacter albigriseus]